MKLIYNSRQSAGNWPTLGRSNPTRPDSGSQTVGSIFGCSAQWLGDRFEDASGPRTGRWENAANAELLVDFGTGQDALPPKQQLADVNRVARRTAAEKSELSDDAKKKLEKRRAQNRKSSRKYRCKNKKKSALLASKSQKEWRSLGHVAGHEVRVFDGPYGVYAMVLGATVDGQACQTFTAGNKSWSLDTVTLPDVLPALLAKWQKVSARRGLDLTGPRVQPTYEDFRDHVDRLTVIKTVELLAVEQTESRVVTRRADGGDAICRHVDVSSASSFASSISHGRCETKLLERKDLGATQASAPRLADALSSMSSLSKSSSSCEEEDMWEEARVAPGDRDAGRIDTAHREDMELSDQKHRHRMLAERFALGLGLSVERVLYLWKASPQYLRRQLEAAGINPNTGMMPRKRDCVTSDHSTAGTSNDYTGSRVTPEAAAEGLSGPQLHVPVIEEVRGTNGAAVQRSTNRNDDEMARLKEAAVRALGAAG
jgi:hypothetical protein